MLPEAAYYHALAVRLESNYKTLRTLRDSHSLWKNAWTALSGNEEEVARLWTAFAAQNVSLVLYGDPAYPALLREIPFPPFALYLRGVLESSRTRSLAIVGTRNASPEGKRIAHSFARSLASRGITVVSGLALGIDAASHAGTIAGNGRTIAVLGNGVDDPHPRTNRLLAEEIIEKNGALVSEYPPGTPPLPFRFLERNRIVSGLTEAVLVVEAPERSGSLATARFALEQNRDVFVIPGSIADPHFKGSHALVKSGAQLVTDPEDILRALGIETEAPAPGEADAELSGEEALVLGVLAQEGRPLEVDKIIELTHLNPHTVNRSLAFLALKEKIRDEGDGRYGLPFTHTS